jgi:DNA-binding NtrC family response regulator
VRFIAATNRRLEQAVQDGLFRSDLYFRLAVIRIEVPPLRQRTEDLPLLIEHFARGLQLQPEGRAPTDRLQGLAPLLATYDWPGNVRELRNVVERLAYLDTSQAIPTAMREAKGNPGSYDDARQQALDQFERTYLRRLLRHTRGNVARAADLAGVSRRYLFRLMSKHEIDRRAGVQRTS